jgi:hypothetical protein
MIRVASVGFMGQTYLGPREATISKRMQPKAVLVEADVGGGRSACPR